MPRGRDKRILYAFTLLTAGLFINVSMILQDGLYEVSRIITGAERIYPCIAALLNLAARCASPGRRLT